MADLDDALIELIAQEALIDRGKLTRDATLADIGLDSVDVVSVVFAVEETYGVDIAPDAFDKISDLGQFLDVLETVIAAKPAV